jgi:hypothetical protein
MTASQGGRRSASAAISSWVLGVGAGGGDDRFQAGLFLGQLVEIGVRFGVGGVHRFQLGLGLHDFAQAGFDFLAHGLGRVELRFLRQVAD